MKNVAEAIAEIKLVLLCFDIWKTGDLQNKNNQAKSNKSTRTKLFCETFKVQNLRSSFVFLEPVTPIYSVRKMFRKIQLFKNSSKGKEQSALLRTGLSRATSRL